MFFAATGWQAQGEEVASALSLAMNDSGHFPLDDLAPEDPEVPDAEDPPPSDDVEETKPPVVFDEALSLGSENDKAVVDALEKLLSGQTEITVGEQTGTFRGLLEAASKSGDRALYIKTVVAAAAVAVQALGDNLPGDAAQARKIERALHQVLFAANSHQTEGSSAETALATALEESGHFSG
jgi:hypothetical protein